MKDLRAPAFRLFLDGQDSASYALEAALQGLRVHGICERSTGTMALGAMEVLFQAGFYDITTNASAVGTITFPKPFPAAFITGIAWSSVPVVGHSTYSVNGFNFVATGYPSTSLGVRWIAIGR